MIKRLRVDHDYDGQFIGSLIVPVNDNEEDITMLEEQKAEEHKDKVMEIVEQREFTVVIGQRRYSGFTERHEANRMVMTWNNELFDDYEILAVEGHSSQYNIRDIKRNLIIGYPQYMEYIIDKLNELRTGVKRVDIK